MKPLFTLLTLLMFSITTTALATPSFGGTVKKSKTAFGTSTGNAFKQKSTQKTGSKPVKTNNNSFISGKGMLCEAKVPGQEQAIYFDGACRTMSWFESHIVSPDATLLMVSGTQVAKEKEGVTMVEITDSGVLRTLHLATTSNPGMLADSNDPSGEHLGYFYNYVGEVVASASQEGDPMITSESYSFHVKTGWDLDFSELTIFSSSHWMICDENGCVDAMALNGDECAVLGVKASSDFLDQCLDSFGVSKEKGFISLFKQGPLGLFHRGGAIGCSLLSMKVGTSTEAECNRVYTEDAETYALNLAKEMADEPEVEEDVVDLEDICDELTNTKLGFKIEGMDGVEMHCNRVESTHCEPSMDDETCECVTYYGPWECVGYEPVEE